MEEDQPTVRGTVGPTNAHVGVDADSVVHSLETSTAKLHDSQVWDELLHGEETSVWPTRATSVPNARLSSPGRARSGAFRAKNDPLDRSFTLELRKAPKGGPLHPVDGQLNRIISRVRAQVEPPFRVFRRQFGHVKARYRGLARNRARLFTLFALGNLFLVRRRLLA